MNKRFLTLLTVLLITVLATSPVAAGGAVRLSKVTFSIGSLIANGYVSGIGNTDVVVSLTASGNARVVCTNPGQNDVPGQSYPKVSASGQQFLPGNNAQSSKNGRTEFKNVETQDPQTIPWDLAGCPNSNWTAYVIGIDWTNATITVKNTSDGVLTSQNYVCNPALQTATTASCTQTN